MTDPDSMPNRSYHTAPLGARSKHITNQHANRERHTTLPRWGRDQNLNLRFDDHGLCIPHCPVGGEIKTGTAGAARNGHPYHTAPLGARSKRHNHFTGEHGAHTTLPRWGRDQNWPNISPQTNWPIPHCPVGGEIKTKHRQQGHRVLSYHTAPLGARSKHVRWSSAERASHTTLPRWGRDQNPKKWGLIYALDIPHCPVGGEIKTLEQQAMKTGNAYHTAPLGARSKRHGVISSSASMHTTLPRWGRDQNDMAMSMEPSGTIPHCPVGGEIKTCA